MAKEKACCTVTGATGRCNVEAIISLDERGQMVLPKDLRTKAGINPGDKLAVVSWEKEGTVCCIMLIHTDQLSDPVKTVVGPMLKEAL
ncbi:MAG TPA: HgcAB-associated protein [Methanolinea sp.]|nr:HgcAB-associated protein [Methanolinea sp.]HQK55151.1 HgcAB-associated protein [Methanolinea sp.]